VERGLNRTVNGKRAPETGPPNQRNGREKGKMQLTQTQRIFSALTARQWRIAAAVSIAVTFMLISTGCNPTWISEAQSIVTTLVTIISSISSILSLFGASISPGVTAAIDAVATDAENELAQVGPLITEYEATPSTGTLSSIVNALNAVESKLTGLLGGITGLSAAMQTKIGAIITLGINTVKELLSLIPAPASSSAEVEAHKVKALAFFEKGPSKKLKDAYNTILALPTGDPEADAVFAKVKHL
jgi:hypothetical protein